MTGEHRVHLCDLGRLLHVPGALALVALVVAALWGEWFALPGFGALAVLSIGAGQTLYRSCRFEPDAEIPEVRSSRALALVALAWALFAAMAAIPFWMVAVASPAMAEFRDPLNALFEAMSGLTSTGLSVAVDASELPRSVQFWRSLLEWVGGIGIVLVALPLVNPAEDPYDLYSAEINADEFHEQTDQMVTRIWQIYAAFTVFGIALFAALGMPLWEALNHAMTGIATGGFSVTSDSFSGYSEPLQLAGAFLMVLGAFSFLTHFRILVDRSWRESARDIQPRALLVLLVAGSLALLLANRVREGEWLVVDSIFQWCSALATGGFNTVPVGEWGGAALLLLTGAMLMGAAAGSTGGGIKVGRVALLVRAIAWRLRALDDPAPEDFEFGGKTWDRAEAMKRVQKAAVVMALFVGTFALGTVALAVVVGGAHSARDLAFEAASALGSVGLSAGVTGPDLAWGARLVLIVLMWVGRLEILAVLVLATVFLDPFRRRFGASEPNAAPADADRQPDAD